MEAKEIYEVVSTLVGKIEPYADASIDSHRKENIKKFIEIFETMYKELDYIAARHSDSPYGSQKEIGLIAKKCLDDLENL